MVSVSCMEAVLTVAGGPEVCNLGSEHCVAQAARAQMLHLHSLTSVRSSDLGFVLPFPSSFSIPRIPTVENLH